MKNYIYLFITFLFITSCEKEHPATIADNPNKYPKSLYADAKVELDYLTFSDYENFFSSLTKMYGAIEEDRLTEERRLGFVSLKTIYSTFNDELDSLEKLDEVNYRKGILELAIKYKDQINFKDDCFTLKSSGLAEACLANSKGIVKVGTDFLYFASNSIETFHDISYAQVLTKIFANNPRFEILPFQNNDKGGTTHGKISFLVGNQSSVNSFSMVSSPFSYTMGNSNRARVYVRAKLYNINNSTLGYRGYVTYEANAQHKNVFGTWRDVKFLFNSGGQVDVNLYKLGLPEYPDGQVINLTNDVSSAPSSIDEGIKEFVIIASQSLIANPSLAVPQNGYIQFNANISSINDDYIQPNGYWRSIASGGFLQSQATFSAMIISGGAFSYPTVDFGTVNFGY